MAAPVPPAEVVERLPVPRLWVFDFDWTVVNENSDTWIHRCAPGGSLPPSVKDSYVPPDWVGYMNRVLGYLAQQGVTAADLQAELQGLPWTPGMRQLLEAIANSTDKAGPVTNVDMAPSAAVAADGHNPPSPSSSAPSPPPSASTDPPPQQAEPSSLPVGAVLPAGARLRGTQHAIILSDANSLFIPWILEGRPCAANGDDGPQGGGEEAGQGHAEGPTAMSPAAAEVNVDVSAVDSRPIDGPGVSSKTGEQVSKGKDCCSIHGGATPVEPSPPPRAHGSGCSSLFGMFVQILTNPARVDAMSGTVIVSPHNGPGPDSAAPPHTCSRCHPNLCKRQALNRFLDEQSQRGVSYGQIAYVGDGRNDLCPSLGLGPRDVVFPRVGFALHKLLGSKKLQPAPAPPPLLTPQEAETAGAGAGANSLGQGTVVGVGSASGPGEGDAPQGGDDGVYVSLGGGQGGQRAPGQGGEQDGEVFRGTCVPWNDAYDIMRWVTALEEQDRLAERVGVMAL